MPKFTVEHDTPLSKTETFAKVQGYLERSEGLRKLDSDLKCAFDQKSFTGHVKGSKFECDLKVFGDGPTKVVLEISIGLLLTPFKGKIHDTLKGKMVQILG